MPQRNLVIRRFGSLSFGIGYYEDGVWVDHTAADAGDEAARGELTDDIHGWYGCCGSDAADTAAIAKWRAERAPAGDAVLAN
jgi:hypothetical protein